MSQSISYCVSNNEQTVACMKAISGKFYSDSEVTTCNGISTNEQTVSCMNVTGRSTRSAPSGCDRGHLLRQVSGAISHVISGNTQAALNTLYNMKSELESCGQ